MAKHTVSINFLANAGQAQNALNNLTKSLTGLSGSIGASSPMLGAMVGGLAAVSGPAALVAGGFAAIGFALRTLGDGIRTLSEFETVMARLKAVVQEDGGDVAANMEYLEYVARRTAKNTRFSMAQAAQGLEELAKAGRTARQAGDSLEGTLNLAQLSGMELGETAEKLADIMTSFGKSSKETNHVVDVMAIVAAKSTTGFAELTEAFKYVGLAGAGMGQTFEEIAAAMGALSGAGVKASMAGTAIRGVLVQLADKSSSAHKELLALGLTSEQITPGPYNQLSQIMKTLADKGVDANTAFAIFGQRAGIAGTAFTTMYDQLLKFNGIIANSDGAARRMAITMDDTLEVSVIKVKNAWNELLAVFNESTSLMSGLKKIMQAIRVAILQVALGVQIMNNAAKNDELLTLMLNVFKYLAASVGNYIYNSLVLAFQAVAAVATGLFTMLASPVFWSGVYQVFMAATYLFASKIAEGMAMLVAGSTQFLVPILTGIFYVRDILVGSAMMAGGVIYGYFELAMNYLRQNFAWAFALWSMLPTIARIVMNLFTVQLSAWIAQFTSMLTGFVTGAIQHLSAFISSVTTFFTMLFNMLTEKLAGIIAIFVTSITSLLGFIMPYLEAIGNFFVGIADTIIGKFNSFLDDAKAVMSFIGGMFRSKVEEAKEGATTAGAAATKAGAEKVSGAGGAAKSEAEAMMKGLRDALSGAAGILGDKAKEAGVIGASEIGDAFGSNVEDPLAALLAGFKPEDMFGQGDAWKKIQEIVFRNMPKAPTAPEGPDDGRNLGGGSGLGEGGLGMAGVNRQATNLIMGRTINEVIAQIAQKQLDKTEESVEQQKATNDKLDEIKKQGGVSTFK